jgi:hypothetical protein
MRPRLRPRGRQSRAIIKTVLVVTYRLLIHCLHSPQRRSTVVTPLARTPQDVWVGYTVGPMCAARLGSLCVAKRRIGQHVERMDATALAIRPPLLLLLPLLLTYPQIFPLTHPPTCRPPPRPTRPRRSPCHHALTSLPLPSRATSRSKKVAKPTRARS